MESADSGKSSPAKQRHLERTPPKGDPTPNLKILENWRAAEKFILIVALCSIL